MRPLKCWIGHDFTPESGSGQLVTCKKCGAINWSVYDIPWWTPWARWSEGRRIRKAMKPNRKPPSGPDTAG